MITLKKKQIEGLLIQLSGITPQGEKVGLLNENIELGMRRGLRNILRELIKEREQYQADLSDAEEVSQKEVDILNNEEIGIDLPRVDRKELYAIRSKTDYDIDLIDLISQ